MAVIDSSKKAGSPEFATVARLLGRVESRLILSTAIIVSLLPFGWVTRLDGAFFLLFAVEFVLRALLIFRGEAAFVHGPAPGAISGNADLAERTGLSRSTVSRTGERAGLGMAAPQRMKVAWRAVSMARRASAGVMAP